VSTLDDAVLAGRIVVDNGAPPPDGDRYTLANAGPADTPGEPEIVGIYPSSIEANGPDVLMHVFGIGFDRESRIVINENVERTSYVSATEVTTYIDGTLWSNPDPAVPLYVRTPNGDTPAVSFAVLTA
jgi:hypothetical protein